MAWKNAASKKAASKKVPSKDLPSKDAASKEEDSKPRRRMRFETVLNGKNSPGLAGALGGMIYFLGPGVLVSILSLSLRSSSERSAGLSQDR